MTEVDGLFVVNPYDDPHYGHDVVVDGPKRVVRCVKCNADAVLLGPNIAVDDLLISALGSDYTILEVFEGGEV